MLHRSLFRLSLLAAVFGLIACTLTSSAQDNNRRGRKYKAPPATARVDILVLRDTNGKPVENAAVIFHPMAGDKDKGNMELKTNEEGKTMIDVLPIGDTVRMQVLAKGFQTYGLDFQVDKPTLSFEIHLKRPGEQYSIYKQHNEAAKTPDADKNAPPTTNDKPATKPEATPSK